MTPGLEISVTLKGKTLADLVSQAETLIAISEGKTPAAKTGKRAAAPVETETEEDTDLLGEEAEDTATEETADEDQLGFDMAEDEEDETPPAPKATKGKPKLTDKMVNDQAMKFAKKHGRPKTKEILKKKFKVESILELKPEQYAAVMTALKV